VKRFKIGVLDWRYKRLSLEKWGLSVTGNKKFITLYPFNLVIPSIRENGTIDRIKLRYPRPTSEGVRYSTLRGSNDRPTKYNYKSSTGVYIVTESELDGILIQQENPEHTAIALGGVGKLPDTTLRQELLKANIILVCFDNEESEATHTRIKQWLDEYPNARACIMPEAKDPTEQELLYRQGKTQRSVKDIIKEALR
jgi:hypothetical protein